MLSTTNYHNSSNKHQNSSKCHHNVIKTHHNSSKFHHKFSTKKSVKTQQTTSKLIKLSSQFHQQASTISTFHHKFYTKKYPNLSKIIQTHIINNHQHIITMSSNKIKIYQNSSNVINKTIKYHQHVIIMASNIIKTQEDSITSSSKPQPKRITCYQQNHKISSTYHHRFTKIIRT